MALKRKITKADFDKLGDAIKAEYKVSGSNKEEYILDTEGDDDGVAAMKAAKDREKAAREDAERRLREREAKDDAAEQERQRKAGDFASIEQSYKDKLAAKDKEIGEKTAGLTSKLHGLLVDNEAQRIASKLSKSPSLLLPIIKSRLKAEYDGDTAITRVLDKDGKPTGLSLGDLEKELQGNPEYASIIIASQGSGGGAPRSPAAGGARQQFQTPRDKDGKPVALRDLNATDLAAAMKERHPELGQQDSK